MHTYCISIKDVFWFVTLSVECMCSHTGIGQL